MGVEQLVLRVERPSDRDGIRAVHDAAFERTAEGEVVDAVRASGAALLSLVALLGDEVVGHVLFSPVTVGATHPVVGLGPLAVSPRHQGQGVGSALVREGLRRLSGMGIGAVVVLGDPRYYGRFGFRRASSFGVRWEQPAPDEAFQALELLPRALAGGGVVRYHPAFG